MFDSRELTALLTGMLSSTAFQTKTGEEVTHAQMRAAFSDADGRTRQIRDALTAEPVVYIGQIEQLAKHLRVLLKRYLDRSNDEIGHSFAILGDRETKHVITEDFASEVYTRSTIPTFARSLVRAAGYLGPERAAELVHEWISGKPRDFKVCVLLVGVHVDEPLALNSGIRLYRLPVSSELFPNSIPDAESDTIADMLGRTVLELDGHTIPAFFNPPAENEEMPSLLSGNALGDFDLNELLTALSLICTRRVDSAWIWNNPCETKAFTGTSSVLGLAGPKVRPRWGEIGGITHTPRTDVVQLSSFTLPTSNLSAGDVQRAWTFLPELTRRMNEEERFKVSVNRWMEAIAQDVQSMDRLIDLRVALEALYIDSDQGELGFRLALTAARHLGTCFEDRKAIQGSLRRFYELSSRAVHGTELSRLRDTDHTAVEQATKLCRDGIVKIAETKKRPDWGDLLLG